MRQAGHQIDRTYGVADRFVLFSERFVRMGVSFVFDHSWPGVAPTDPVPGTAAFFELDIVIVGLLPTFFDEEAGQRLIARFPGDFIQAHQRQFDFRMSWIAAKLSGVRPEDGINVVGKAAGNFQQTTFTGGAIKSDSCFKKMPGTVQFMTLCQVSPALTRFFYGIPGIEIAVFTLRLRQQFDRFVSGLFERRVRFLA